VSRRKTSPAADVVDLLGWAPWWLGVVLAIASFFWLHSVAAGGPPIVRGAKAVSSIAPLVWTAANIGQYVLPILFASGAALSVIRRRRRNQLHEQAGSGAEAIAGMSWAEFEVLVGEAFRRRGYQVVETGGGGADGGVDLVLRKAGEKTFVQCKQWKAYKVRVNVVRELAGVMAAHGAAHGVVVTSGRFTQEAEAFGKHDGSARRDAREQRGQGVLGLFELPSVQRHQANKQSVASLPFAEPRQRGGVMAPPLRARTEVFSNVVHL
jgi:restriction system protein